MMELNRDNKPYILIGFEEEHVSERIIKEIELGVEEEGCLFQRYAMESGSDLRYSAAGVTALVCGSRITLHTREMPPDEHLIEAALTGAASEDAAAARAAGKNAGRYLKKKKLYL